MPDQAYKRCGKCGIAKPTTDFYRDRGKKDGFCAHCKPCRKAADYSKPLDVEWLCAGCHTTEHQTEENQ